MTGQSEIPMPDAGGSYIRDPATGALKVPEVAPEAAPDAADPPTAKPVAKPVNKPVKEA